jgi:hypothetical protein
LDELSGILPREQEKSCAKAAFLWLGRGKGRGDSAAERALAKLVYTTEEALQNRKPSVFREKIHFNNKKINRAITVK